jgi:hypothetical protein
MDFCFGFLLNRSKLINKAAKNRKNKQLNSGAVKMFFMIEYCKVAKYFEMTKFKLIQCY